MLTFEPDGGSLQLEDRGLTLKGWRLAVEADGSILSSGDAQVEVLQAHPLALRMDLAGSGISWTIRTGPATDGETILIDSVLENRGTAGVALGKAWLMRSDGVDGFGTPDTDPVCLPLFGEILGRSVVRLGDPNCPRASKIKCQFYSRATQQALQVGFVTFRRANTEVAHGFDRESGITGLRAWCDFAGWVLEPGQTTETETFALMTGASPYRQLERWADLAAERCAPRRWEDAPIGWVGWAWVDPFTVERYENVVLRNCAAIRERLAGFGVNYVWTSLGNIRDVNPGDWLNWNDEFFPGGPHHLAARLREMGFRWGLWCGVFWMCSLLEDKVAAYREALLKNPDGSLMVVRGEWQFGAGGEMPKAERPVMYALDPSHPKALALLRETFETYREWGVRYYMLDFLHAGSGNISSHPYADHHDRTLVAGPEAYHHALRVVREAAGDDTYFLSSSGPTVHNAGSVDAIRTGNDFGEGRALYPDSYFYPATYAINSGSVWTGPLRALTNQASAWYTHRKLYVNDSGNVLTVDKPLPLRDAQVHATIHAMSGGPSMIGDDVDRMDDDRLALIKATLPRPREVAFPVDLFDSPLPDHPKVFHRTVERPWGRFDVVAVYNFGEDLLRQPVEAEALGLPADRPMLVWEFWNSEYVGRGTGSFQAVVPPGSVRVYRLTVDEGRPAILGTDMHLLMGEVEILACDWNERSKTLTGTAIRPAGERGNVFFYVPPSLRVDNPKGLWIAKDARESCLIVRASLSFEAGTAGWALRCADASSVPDLASVDLT